jgi:hypothetical protein
MVRPQSQGEAAHNCQPECRVVMSLPIEVILANLKDGLAMFSAQRL